MPEQSSKPAPDTPVLREANGGLSLLFDDGTVQSHMLEVDPAGLVLEYTRLMMGFLLFQPAPARIAMIGLGGGSLAKYCGLKLPDSHFTAVEISPEVIALRDVFGIPLEGPRFRVLCVDGADFVRADGEPFDVLLVDGFDRGGQPERLCSAAFYDDCRHRLAEGGVLVVNLHSDDGAGDILVDRIRDSFAGKIIVVQADESDNMVVFAGTDRSFPPTFSEMVERLRALEASHPVRLDATVRKILQPGEPRRPPRRRGRRRGA